MASSLVTACGGGSQATGPSTRPARTTARTGPSATSSTTVPSALKTTFGDGTWIVGRDIAPGIYSTQRAGRCHYDVEGGSGGGQHANIADADSSGQAVVTVGSTDRTFTSQGCGTWVKQ